MAQSLSNVLVHLTFSTRHRAPVLVSTIQPELHAYGSGVLKNLGHVPVAVGGYDDHVHALFRLAKTEALSETVKELKTSTNHWLKKQNSGFQDFAWQNGYAAFSISEKEVPVVAHYINNQATHHQKLSFQDEFRRLMNEYGVAFDERFAWD